MSKKTHFEQVPVEIVKQIAREEPLEDIADEGTERPVSNSPESSDGGQGNEWRKVAEAIVLEKDTGKIMLLAERLNRALELRQGASRNSTAKG